MGDATYDGPERRDMDTITSLLSGRIDGVERHTEKNSRTLEDHVKDCATMQRRVLLVGATILIWLVAHSPEAAHLVAKMLPSLGGA